MPTFTTTFSESEYQKLRHASMRGKFTYDFNRDKDNEVEFIVKNKYKEDFLQELEALFDSGESSWRDILVQKTKSRCNK